MGDSIDRGASVTLGRLGDPPALNAGAHGSSTATTAHPGEIRKLLLVLSVATPPASGKSTVLKGVATQIGAPVVSSDDFVNRDGKPDHMGFETAAQDACLNTENTSDVRGCRVVVFDKNVPNLDGWNKFKRIFTPTFRHFEEVYAVQFCPRELGEKEENVIQQRMAQRVPKEGKTVLSTQTHNYATIMFTRFLPWCRNSLSDVHALRGTMVTDLLFTDGEADTIVRGFIQHIEGGPTNWYHLKS
jgi:hypothetical protein